MCMREQVDSPLLKWVFGAESHYFIDIIARIQENMVADQSHSDLGIS